MLPYILVGLLIILIVVLSGFSNKFKLIGFILISALLLSLCVLRSINVGTDFHWYKEFFYTIGRHPISHWESQLILVKKEYGWYFMNKVFYNYGTFFLYVVAFYSIMMFLIFKTVWEKSTIPLLSLLLYFFCGFYFVSYNIMRQVFVFALFLYSIRYIESKSFLKYLFIIGLASQFHLSALFLLPFYFIKIFKWSKTFLIAAIILSLVFGYMNIFQKIVPLINIQRLQSMINLQHKSFSIFGYLTFALTSSICVAFLILSKDINSDKSLYMKFVVFGIIMSNLVMHFQWLFRFSEGYFAPILIIAYPRVISEHARTSNKMLLTGFLLIYSFTLFLLSVSNNSNGIIPYSFIFSKP